MEISNGHYQAMASHPLGEIIANCPKQYPHEQQQQNLPTEKKPRPQPEHALKCPRCESTDTKFCYYNNYSLSQPRFFCKGCRRYWTQGGSLRNVPVGGGCRKNRRASSSSSKKVTSSTTITTTATAISDQSQALSIPTALGASSLPPLPYDHSDLTLAFACLHNNHIGATHVPAAHPGFLEFLRSRYIDHNNQNPAGVHNFYYGNFGGGVEEVAQEMVLSIDHSGGLDSATATGSSTPTTSASQGSCKLMDGTESSKVMMGLQWQLGSDGNIGNTPMDSATDLWSNGGSGGSWHGLINGSLM